MLHHRALRSTDEGYLAHHIAGLSAGPLAAVVRRCLERAPRCRFLLVQMAFGRSELPALQGALERFLGGAAEVVVVTTAGASPRWRAPRAKGRRRALLQKRFGEGVCVCVCLSASGAQSWPTPRHSSSKPA